MMDGVTSAMDFEAGALNFQFSQNLALTPSVQWLVDPAQNPGEDQVWILGLRARMTL